MINCKSCKKEISKKAKTCPDCGHPNKRTSIVTWAFGALVVTMIAFSFNKEPGTYTNTKSPREQSIESQFSAWSGSHRAVEKEIKQSMNNPDSYEHIETKYVDNTSSIIVYTKFRGSNAFGAIVVNSAKAIVSNNGVVISLTFDN